MVDSDALQSQTCGELKYAHVEDKDLRKLYVEWESGNQLDEKRRSAWELYRIAPSAVF